MSPVPKRVGLLHISRVISEVFGERLTAGGQGVRDTFPLQQKVLLCSLLLLARRLRAREVTLGKVSGGETLSGLDLGSGRVSLGCLSGAVPRCNACPAFPSSTTPTARSAGGSSSRPSTRLSVCPSSPSSSPAVSSR